MNSIRRLEVIASVLTIGLALLIVVAICYYWYSGTRVVTSSSVAATVPLVLILVAGGWAIGTRRQTQSNPSTRGGWFRMARWLALPLLLIWPTVNLIAIVVLLESMAGAAPPGGAPLIAALTTFTGAVLGVVPMLCMGASKPSAVSFSCRRRVGLGSNRFIPVHRV